MSIDKIKKTCDDILSFKLALDDTEAKEKLNAMEEQLDRIITKCEKVQNFTQGIKITSDI